MAKRSRIGARPGQRKPLQRTSARPTLRSTLEVTPEEEARAAEYEAAILAEEKAADEARKGRAGRAEAPADTTIYSSATLAHRAAQEYAYVQRDLRRIAIVGGGLLIVLAVLDVLVNQLNLI